METLSFGFKKPQTGDKGSVWFPALEDTIEQLNDHTHNGTNSSRLSVAALTVLTQTIDNSAWSAVASQTGTYRRLITVPGGVTDLDEVIVTFKHGTTKDILFLTYEKQSATTYYVYVNDNSIGLVANYGV